MGNVSGAFPTPYDASNELLPTWAIAVVAASAGVTLLWIIAIILLVVFEVLGGSSRSETYVVRNQRELYHAGSQASLGSPPPPVTPPPPRRSSSRSSQVPQLVSRQSSRRSQRSEVRVNPGYRESIAVPATDPFESEEREYKLSVRDDQLSLASSDSHDSDTEVKKKPLSTGASPVEGATSVSPQTSLNGSPRSPTNQLSGMVLSRPITVRQLGATLREPNYIDTEFRKLPTPSVTSEDCPPGVERKNRYTNVLPTPRSRVPLELLFGHPSSDYINANYIRGHKGSPKQYIATQGPLDNTVEDFWRMVWENSSEVIIMATNFQERGIDKCSRYWPAQGSEQYGSVEVTLLNQTTEPTYNKTKLQVRLLSGGETRCVDHYRLTSWPQQGVPKNTSTITDFLKEVKMADSSGPAIVHCSAGIGRTGVLIAVDIGLQGLLQGDGKMDVLRIVSTMRQDRAGCVQTRDQYRFIHQCLYDFARSSLK